MKHDYVEQSTNRRKGILHFIFAKQDGGESIFEAVMAGIFSLGLMVAVLVLLAMFGG